MKIIRYVSNRKINLILRIIKSWSNFYSIRYLNNFLFMPNSAWGPLWAGAQLLIARPLNPPLSMRK